MSPTTTPHRRRQHHVRRPMAALVAGVALVLALAGCGDDSSATGGTAASTGRTGEALDGEITVGAAASLTESFTAIGAAFGDENPDVDVTFTFDSSSTIATQVEEGAPIDVVAAADTATTDRLAEQDLVGGEPTTFAGNELVIVTRPGNPEAITGLVDLADVGTVSLCGEEVPCGGYAAEVLAAADVEVPESSVTRGQNAKATLTAVSEGDAVAGIVYATDATAQGDSVEVVDIPDDLDAIAEYPIALVAATDDADLAEAFVAFVLGDEGRAILADHGFLPPP